jgi:hypothetical protein
VIASSDAPASVEIHTTPFAPSITFATDVSSSENSVRGAAYTSTFTFRKSR